MHTTEFYDPTTAAVIKWQAAVKRACDIQPTSRPDMLTAEMICQITGLLPLFPFVPAEGMVATGSMTINIIDGVAYKHYDTITQEQYDEQQALDEASRIQGLAENYGQRVAALGAYLQVFGYAMPIDPDRVFSELTTKLLTGQITPEDQPKVSLLKDAYDYARQAMSDEDMVKVGEVLSDIGAM
jgi:hypothetical protein